MGSVDVVDSELERLRAENVRLSRLLELRGLDTAPTPEQLSAAVAPPGLVTSNGYKQSLQAGTRRGAPVLT